MLSCFPVLCSCFPVFLHCKVKRGRTGKHLLTFEKDFKVHFCAFLCISDDFEKNMFSCFPVLNRGKTGKQEIKTGKPENIHFYSKNNQRLIRRSFGVFTMNYESFNAFLFFSFVFLFSCFSTL